VGFLILEWGGGARDEGGLSAFLSYHLVVSLGECVLLNGRGEG
jgi:hypothetical protein